jgi:hypothetical protein
MAAAAFGAAEPGGLDMNRTISWCALLSALLWAGAALGQLDKDQQKCLNTLNNDAAKLAKAQGKENSDCLKKATHGTLRGGQSADACLLADGKGRIAAAQAAITTHDTERCSATPPTFVFPAARRRRSTAPSRATSRCRSSAMCSAPR